MAKIQTQNIVVTLNKLVKDADPDFDNNIASDDLVVAIEQIANELAGAGVVVEIQVVV